MIKTSPVWKSFSI